MARKILVVAILATLSLLALLYLNSIRPQTPPPPPEEPGTSDSEVKVQISIDNNKTYGTLVAHKLVQTPDGKWLDMEKPIITLLGKSRNTIISADQGRMPGNRNTSSGASLSEVTMTGNAVVQITNPAVKDKDKDHLEMELRCPNRLSFISKDTGWTLSADEDFEAITYDNTPNADGSPKPSMMVFGQGLHAENNSVKSGGRSTDIRVKRIGEKGILLFNRKLELGRTAPGGARPATDSAAARNVHILCDGHLEAASGTGQPEAESVVKAFENVRVREVSDADRQRILAGTPTADPPGAELQTADSLTVNFARQETAAKPAPAGSPATAAAKPSSSLVIDKVMAHSTPDGKTHLSTPDGIQMWGRDLTFSALRTTEKKMELTGDDCRSEMPVNQQRVVVTGFTRMTRSGDVTDIETSRNDTPIYIDQAGARDIYGHHVTVQQSPAAATTSAPLNLVVTGSPSGQAQVFPKKDGKRTGELTAADRLTFKQTVTTQQTTNVISLRGKGTLRQEDSLLHGESIDITTINRPDATKNDTRIAVQGAGDLTTGRPQETPPEPGAPAAAEAKAKPKSKVFITWTESMIYGADSALIVGKVRAVEKIEDGPAAKPGNEPAEKPVEISANSLDCQLLQIDFDKGKIGKITATHDVVLIDGGMRGTGEAFTREGNPWGSPAEKTGGHSRLSGGAKEPARLYMGEGNRARMESARFDFDHGTKVITGQGVGALEIKGDPAGATELARQDVKAAWKQKMLFAGEEDAASSHFGKLTLWEKVHVVSGENSLDGERIELDLNKRRAAGAAADKAKDAAAKATPGGLQAVDISTLLAVGNVRATYVSIATAPAKAPAAGAPAPAAVKKVYHCKSDSLRWTRDEAKTTDLIFVGSTDQAVLAKLWDEAQENVLYGLRINIRIAHNPERPDEPATTTALIEGPGYLDATLGAPSGAGAKGESIQAQWHQEAYFSTKQHGARLLGNAQLERSSTGDKLFATERIVVLYDEVTDPATGHITRALQTIQAWGQKPGDVRLVRGDIESRGTVFEWKAQGGKTGEGIMTTDKGKVTVRNLKTDKTTEAPAVIINDDPSIGTKGIKTQDAPARVPPLKSTEADKNGWKEL